MEINVSRKEKQPKPFPLLDHRLMEPQKEAQVAIRKAFMRGSKAVLAELPTGTGKTVVFTLLPKQGARTLVVVPLSELVGQTVRSIRRFREVEADVEQADCWATPGQEFTVACWASLMSNDRYKRFLGNVDLLVVDEAHNFFTVRARDILQQFIESGTRVLGVSATCYRGDKQSLLGFYEEIAYSYRMKQAIDDGFLVPIKCRVHYVKSVDLSKVRARAGDFNQEELDLILRSEAALHDVAGLYKQNHKPGSQAIMFAHSIAQATAIRNILLDRYGVSASLVHSKMPAAEFKSELKAFTSGENDLIVNVGCLCTGFDAPKICEVYINKPTMALNKLTQMIGRGTRVLAGTIDPNMSKEQRLAAIAASDKTHTVVHDLTDSTRSNKLRSAIDVLAEQADKKVIQKVKARAEKEEIDIDPILQEEILAAQEEARLLKDAERKRRQKLVVGLEFDSHERDIFLDPDRDTPKRREFRVLWGKWKGQPLRAVPLNYLRWQLREGKMSPYWRQVYADHINIRESMERQDIERGIRRKA